MVDNCQSLTILGAQSKLEVMNISLTPELEEFVQSKVRSGMYTSQSEVVREALRLLADHDRVRESQLARLRQSLIEGLQQAERGELLDGASVVEEIRSKLEGPSEQDKKTG